MRRRVGKWTWIGLGGLLLLCAANHAEYGWRRAHAPAAGPDLAVAVRQEGNASTHRTIGVDEAALTDPAGRLLLRFSTLMAWKYDKETNPPCPKDILALAGRSATAVGFMYPLEAGVRVKTFCLLRSTQTCCYGPRPQYNQYLLVETKAPVRFERLAAVVVEGRFFAEAKPEDGYIYRMDNASARAADPEEAEIDVHREAAKAGLKVFDFASLAALKPTAAESRPAVPPDLAALEGQRVVVEGYCVGQVRGQAPGIILGRAWWDGVSQGTPPNLYNAVKVFLAAASEFPTRWNDRLVFTGTLHVTADPAAWPAEGRVCLRDAVKGLPGRGKRAEDPRPGGPYLPLWVEALALVGYLAVAVVRPWSLRTRSASL